MTNHCERLTTYQATMRDTQYIANSTSGQRRSRLGLRKCRVPCRDHCPFSNNRRPPPVRGKSPRHYLSSLGAAPALLPPPLAPPLVQPPPPDDELPIFGLFGEGGEALLFWSTPVCPSPDLPSPPVPPPPAGLRSPGALLRNMHVLPKRHAPVRANWWYVLLCAPLPPSAAPETPRGYVFELDDEAWKTELRRPPFEVRIRACPLR